MHWGGTSAAVTTTPESFGPSRIVASNSDGGEYDLSDVWMMNMLVIKGNEGQTGDIFRLTIFLDDSITKLQQA